MKIKKITFLLIVVMILISLNEIRDAYGLFESEKNLTVEKSVAKWNVEINGVDVKTSEEFLIDSFHSEVNSRVVSGKIAPGGTGYFDIVIDPTDTQVSFRYDLSFDFSNLSESIIIERIEETLGNEILRTGENTYTNIFSLDDIENGVTNNIRVYLKWINIESNNDSDSSIGIQKNNILDIVTTINVEQYLGEEIIIYEEEME